MDAHSPTRPTAPNPDRIMISLPTTASQRKRTLPPSPHSRQHPRGRHWLRILHGPGNRIAHAWNTPSHQRPGFRAAMGRGGDRCSEGASATCVLAFLVVFG
ncbi:hypothetical protein CPB84DRAFT_1784029 [Gymnopilus junonius]|uniref:Uncharacterized protein n=1 Tax=Gymnopilus junonius TaxID=109634 RepID=A0A9P5NHB6_GYMJU|nr:hypothetical protein CPB84DRAFT_1784029 [Gymnopilus junonius]